MSVEAGLLGEEGRQAVPIDTLKFAPFGHIYAADAVEGHAVQVVDQADANLIGLVLGAAGQRELQAVPQVAKLLGAGHGKKAIAAKLLQDDLGDSGRHLAGSVR